MAWHFDERTGSRFWLDLARTLPFDPRRDIQTVADLAQFPDISQQLRSALIEDLLPRGCEDVADGVRLIFESGGTTGPPKRVVQAGFVTSDWPWVTWLLDLHGAPGPGAGNWLHLGPAGPHLVSNGIWSFAHMRKAACFFVDLDPRWVKRCVREGRVDDAQRYVAHVIEQAEWVLSTQRIVVMFTTPPLLEAITARSKLLDLVQTKVRVIIWGGTSMSAEALRTLESEVLPDVTLIGLYGNTLMGPALQRPRVPEDTEDCVFQPFHPYVQLSIVDPASNNQVDYGERGQVVLHRLSRDVFLPNIVERDTALRLAPAPPFTGDGVADVAPVSEVRGTTVIEGVY
jgi:hypothetical protein